MMKILREGWRLVLTEYGIHSPVKLTIALVTDLHEGNPDETIKLLKQAQPDIICIAGDTFERYGVGDNLRRQESPGKFHRLIHKLAFVLDDILYGLMRSHRENNPEDVYRFLEEVSRVGNRTGGYAAVYMSLGNHDWRLDKRDKKALRKAGITLLDNGAVDAAGFLIGGLSTRVDKTWLSRFSSRPGYKILLCHHPEYYDKYLKDREIDLILSGHAHGGQIRLFGRGVFAPGQGLFPKYHHGVYDGRLVVSAGCANTASIPRWGNPREVVVVKLADLREGNSE